MPIALGLFAMGDHLLYYSAEIKQYSCDLVLALAGLLLAAPQPPAVLSTRRFLGLVLFGLIAPWFSFPSVFVLAGVGIHLLASELLRRDRARAAMVAGMGLAWLLSFGGCFLLSRSILSKRDFIWVWWNFAFLPLPPRSFADLSLLAETLANVFINPGSLLSPMALPYTAGLACLLAMAAASHSGGGGRGGSFWSSGRSCSPLPPRGFVSIRFTAGFCSVWCPRTSCSLPKEWRPSAGAPAGP